MTYDVFEYYYCDFGRVSFVHSFEDAGSIDLSCLRSAVHAPIEQGQIRFVRNFNLEVAGYYTWAKLTPFVSEKYINHPDYRLHPSEWNEGDEFWIIGLCARKRFLKNIYNDIVQEFAGLYCAINWRSARTHKHYKLKLTRNMEV